MGLYEPSNWYLRGVAPTAYTAEDDENEGAQRRSVINRMMFEKKMFLAGSWGADFHLRCVPRTTRSSCCPQGRERVHTDLADIGERDHGVGLGGGGGR